MAFRTITARYDGTCRRCGETFAAGTKIRHGGRGRSYHLAADCDGADGADDGRDGVLYDRGYGAPVRVHTYYSPASGFSGVRNARGRCEDAPCCGCCTY